MSFHFYILYFSDFFFILIVYKWSKFSLSLFLLLFQPPPPPIFFFLLSKLDDENKCECSYLIQMCLQLLIFFFHIFFCLMIFNREIFWRTIIFFRKLTETGVSGRRSVRTGPRIPATGRTYYCTSPCYIRHSVRDRFHSELHCGTTSWKDCSCSVAIELHLVYMRGAQPLCTANR